SQFQLRVDEILPGGEPSLVEPRGFCRSERLVGEVRKRWASPELNRRPELGNAIIGRRGTRLGNELLETPGIELIRPEMQHIAELTGLDQLRAQLLAELRDVVV